MLEHVAALVGGDGGSGDGIAVIDVTAEVHGLVGRVVVVGKGSPHTDYRNIVHPVAPEHHRGHFRACHTAAVAYLGIF